MNILSHPNIQLQDSENLQRPFAVQLRLAGEYTVPSLLDVLKTELIPRIQDDLRLKTYRLASIVPDSVIGRESDDHWLWVESVRCQTGGSANKVFADERARSNYYGSLWHTHGKTTSALATKSGSLPTLFVTDERELLDSLGLENYQGGESLWHSVDERSGVRSASIRSRVLQTKRSLVSKLTLPPTYGTINVFAGDVIHASGEVEGEEEPGDLFIEQWPQ